MVICVQLKTMGFKHTGVFPEQAVNWDFTGNLIRNAPKPLKVLNLFAYTGGATLACAQAGASVCHVDASKGMVAWARENAAASGLSDRPIRWLVDDCIKFVQREQRRGNRYDGIIMDLHPMEEVPAARCGSWRSSCFLWWNCAGAYCLPTLSFFC